MLEPIYGFEFVVVYLALCDIPKCQPHYENTADKLTFDYFFPFDARDKGEGWDFLT